MHVPGTEGDGAELLGDRLSAQLAGWALTARSPVEECGGCRGHTHRARGVVVHDEAGRPEAGTDTVHPLERDRRFEVRCGEWSIGDAAEDHLDPASRPSSATNLVDEPAQRCPQFDLGHGFDRNIAAHGADHRSGGIFGAE